MTIRPWPGFRVTRAVAAWVGSIVICGCPADEESGSEPEGSGTTQSTPETTGESPTTVDPSTMSSGATDSPTTGDPSAGETTGEDPTTGNSFIETPDGGALNECDIWAQDCPNGEKCMPWANDGGSSWNATKCTQIDPNPGQPGDTCTVEGGGVSGVDDCDLASMCWNVDPETNEGSCVPFCEGSADNPVCSNPDEGCSITNDGVLILCLPFCDPLLQDCADGEACYPEPNGFFCSPDASGPDAGAYGDPCEFLNVCDPGLWCAAAEAVPGCVGSGGCCSEFCDISDPAATCAGDGQECTPYYEQGSAPPGYEDVGVCVIPQ